MSILGLSPGPRPSIGGELGFPNYGSNWLGRSVYGPYPFLWQQGCRRCGVSRCGPAAAVVGRGC